MFDSKTAATPAGNCHRCGGQLYDNLYHTCSTAVTVTLPRAVCAPSTDAAYEASADSDNCPDEDWGEGPTACHECDEGGYCTGGCDREGCR